MKDIHTYGKEMARNGRTKDIYKGTFVCIQTLGLPPGVGLECFQSSQDAVSYEPSSSCPRITLLNDLRMILE